MDNGWIKLHRKILNNPISAKPTWVWLWITLLLLANHESDHEFIWNGANVKLKKGQFVTGRKKLKEITGIPETTIEDILKYLETRHQIRQQKTSKYRLITILKWEDYQNPDIKSDNRATTERHIQEIQEIQEDTILATKVAKPSKNKFDSLGAEVVKAFEVVDPKNKTYYNNTTQRKACDYLLETYGLEEVLKRISVLPRTNKVPYFPKINSPNDLKEKWVKLQDAVDSKRTEINTKKNYIL